MLRKYCYFLLLALLPSISFSQEVAPAELSAFVEKGYKILSFSYGDLNLDSAKNDALILLADEQEWKENYNEIELKPRILIALLRQANGSLKKITSNSQLVLGKLDGGAKGDPFSKLAISKGYFTLEELGGNRDVWENYTTFKFDGKSDWLLFKLTTVSYDGFSPKKTRKQVTKTSKDFGKVPFADCKGDN